MKTFGIFLSLFGIFFISQASAALAVPENLSVLSAGDSSFSLDWDDSKDAMGYYIYYGTKTGSGTNYEIEGVDLIEKSEFTLEKLLPETRYYIAVRGVDEFGTESGYSQEIEYMTLKKGQKNEVVNLRITKVSIIDANTLEFLFSTSLDTSGNSPRNFLIENTTNRTESVIDISEIDPKNPKNVLVVLKNPLLASQSYKVTVLDIRDASGKNIESGIDAFLNFTTPALFEGNIEKPAEDLPLTSAPEETTKGDISSDIPIVSVNGNNAGETVSSGNIPKSTMQEVAKETVKLPQTGPVQWILLFITFICSTLIFFFHSRMTSLKK